METCRSETTAECGYIKPGQFVTLQIESRNFTFFFEEIWKKKTRKKRSRNSALSIASSIKHSKETAFYIALETAGNKVSIGLNKYSGHRQRATINSGRRPAELKIASACWFKKISISLHWDTFLSSTQFNSIQLDWTGAHLKMRAQECRDARSKMLESWSDRTVASHVCRIYFRKTLRNFGAEYCASQQMTREFFLSVTTKASAAL